MAEIKIEKKKPVWPWILLGVLIIGIIAYVLVNNNDDDFSDDSDDYMSNEIEDTRKDSTDTYNSRSTIYNPDDDYEDSKNSMAELMIVMKDSTRFGTDSTFTKEAFQKLAKVTVEKAKEFNIETSTALSSLELNTSMTSSSTTDHTKLNTQIKSMSDNITSVIEAIQKKQMPNKETGVSKLKQTSAKLNTTTDLAKQQANIQMFMRQAHDLLHNMNS